MCTRARGVRPSRLAFSDVVSRRAAAPSLIWDELPAWMTPSGLNAGLSVANFSIVVPRRTPSSVSNTSPSGKANGAISFVNRPSSIAVAALSCDARENSSSLRPGELPAVGHQLGAESLVELSRLRTAPEAIW